MKSQIVTSSWGGKRKLPRVFTEQGVAMLAGILKSKIAVKISIYIMCAFVEMRKFILSNAQIFQRLDRVELKLLENDQKFDKVFTALESEDRIPKQGVFYEGEIFNAYKFVSDLFRSAEKSIVIIDNYIDDTLLLHLTKAKKTVKVKILTAKIPESFKLDMKRFEKHHSKIEIQVFKKAHDRFIILDDEVIYHFGASLKDLGNKLFGFSRMDRSLLNLEEI